MKNLEELTDRELAALTAEEVTAMSERQMMIEGVHKPVAAALQEVPEVPEPENTYWVVSIGGQDLYFANKVDAQTAVEALIALSLVKKGYPSSSWSTQVIKDDRPDGFIDIKAERIYREHEYEVVRSALELAKAAKENNKSEQQRYEEDLKAVAHIEEDIRSRIGSAVNRIRQHERVISTWNDYCTTCDGDMPTAMRFLQKLFSAIEIRDAARHDESAWPVELTPVVEEENDEVAA